MKRLQRIVLVLFTTLYIGCALPVRENLATQGFVPKHDLNSVDLVGQGMLYFNKNQFPEAELTFRQALYLNPDSSPIKLNLALVLERQGLYDESMYFLKEVQKKDPNSLPIGHGLARIAAASGQYELASDLFLSTIEKAQYITDLTTAANLSRSYSALLFKIGKTSDALCVSSQSLLFRSDPPDLEKHAKLLMALGKYAEVIALLEQKQAEKNLQRDPKLLHQRAMALFGLGKFNDAMILEQSALQSVGLDPNTLLEITFIRDLSFILNADPDLKTLEVDSELPDEDSPLYPHVVTAKKSLDQLKDINQAVLLYWPLNLVELYHRLIPEEVVVSE